MRRRFIILKKSTRYNRAIGVDSEVADEILEFLGKTERYKEKADYMFRRILETHNMYYENYKRIQVLQGMRVSEMRFFPNGDNCRIYCCEVSNLDGNLFIIMAKLLPKKKDQKITKRIMQVLNTLKAYQYE